MSNIAPEIDDAPETDAQHTEAIASLTAKVEALAEEIRTYAEMVKAERDFPDQLVAELEQAAEYQDESAEALRGHATHYQEAFQGTREDAERHGGHVPGMDQNVQYWKETA